jgi:hypothetical protein
MPPLARKPTIEESVFGGITRGWVYFIYAIRQFIILFPCLWAGYERGRRKEERIKKMRKQCSDVNQTKKRITRPRIRRSTRIKWTENGHEFLRQSGYQGRGFGSDP